MKRIWIAALVLSFTVAQAVPALAQEKEKKEQTCCKKGKDKCKDGKCDKNKEGKAGCCKKG